MIEKHSRSVTPRTVCDFFWDEVGKYSSPEVRVGSLLCLSPASESSGGATTNIKLDLTSAARESPLLLPQEVPPVMYTGRYYLVSIFRDELFVVAAVKEDTSPLLIIEFMHRVVDMFVDYFGAVDEMSIKENFSTCYQLLEEMLDYGYPLTTEPNALKAMVMPPTVMGKVKSMVSGESTAVAEDLGEGMISSMPWRKAGVKYAQNEIYIDVIEEVRAGHPFVPLRLGGGNRACGGTLPPGLPRRQCARSPLTAHRAPRTAHRASFCAVRGVVGVSSLGLWLGRAWVLGGRHPGQDGADHQLRGDGPGAGQQPAERHPGPDPHIRGPGRHRRLLLPPLRAVQSLRA